MKVAGFAGYSGAGKTTLLEGVIRRLRQAGQRVSVIKHAHCHFDIDKPGKDSYRHREAGAYEVLIASSRRMALLREWGLPEEHNPELPQLVAELSAVDWVLVEGFKFAAIPKLEVWRAEAGHAALYPHDPFVVAVVTDEPAGLPAATGLPVLDINDPPSVADFLLQHSRRFDYAAA
jgi:molybdopterin-guanine dinucleotide biosynthesis protein B